MIYYTCIAISYDTYHLYISYHIYCILYDILQVCKVCWFNNAAVSIVREGFASHPTIPYHSIKTQNNYSEQKITQIPNVPGNTVVISINSLHEVGVHATVHEVQSLVCDLTRDWGNNLTAEMSTAIRRNWYKTNNTLLLL
mgnify:CR=1 FL=1